MKGFSRFRVTLREFGDDFLGLFCTLGSFYKSKNHDSFDSVVTRLVVRFSLLSLSSLVSQLFARNSPVLQIYTNHLNWGDLQITKIAREVEHHGKR